MTSAAITDHGAMYGVVDFYKYAKSIGIHPVIGCEVYVSATRMQEKSGRNGQYYHLVLLAENNLGYRNLVKIVSTGFIEGFYYRPRVDFGVLEKYHEGIIALSACLGGEIPKKLLRGSYREAFETASKYLALFGRDHYYLELQDHGIPEQKKVNEQLVRIGAELGIPLVATNDVHYTRKEDAESHDLLLCIQTQKKLEDENRLRYEGEEYYVKSPSEMERLFSGYEGALANTADIAARCQVEFVFHDYHLPHITPPDGLTSQDYFLRLCEEGLVKRYPQTHERHRAQLNYEIDTIRNISCSADVWAFRSQSLMLTGAVPVLRQTMQQSAMPSLPSGMSAIILHMPYARSVHRSRSPAVAVLIQKAQGGMLFRPDETVNAVSDILWNMFYCMKVDLKNTAIRMCSSNRTYSYNEMNRNLLLLDYIKELALFLFYQVRY